MMWGECMNLQDFFESNGSHVAIDGSKPRLLDDPEIVWMVAGGNASIFITDLTPDGKPGRRDYLFQAAFGDLLFGLPGNGVSTEKCLLAVGSSDSYLIGLSTLRLKELPADDKSDALRRAHHWLSCLGVSGAEGAQSPSEFLFDESYRNDCHLTLLAAIAEHKKAHRLAESRQLKTRADSGNRMTDAALYQLAAVHLKERESFIRDTGEDPLFTACQLIGQHMHIDIKVPVREGSDALSLEMIARASRIRHREVALDTAWFTQDGGPILGFMEGDGSPVALIPDSPSSYILNDPAKGIQKKVDRKTAAQIRTRGVVFFRPFEDRTIHLHDILLFGLQSSWKRDLAIIFLIGILGGLLATAVPMATSIVFDSIIPAGEKSALLQIAVILGASALASMLFELTRSLATLRLEAKMDGSVQAAVWDRLFNLPVTFFKKYSSGELAMRAMGISGIRRILSGATLNTILSGIFSFFTLALLFYFDVRLATVAALLAVLAGLAMTYLGYRKVTYERKVLDVTNQISGLMLQLLGGVTKFRVAGAENRAFARWARVFATQRELAFRRESIANALTVLNSVVPVAAGIIIFSAMTASGSFMSVGQFVGFYAAFTSFLLSMVSLSNALIGANLVIPLYQRAKPILEALPEDDATKADPQTLTGAIEVSHVSFRYQENAPLVLRDVTFQINAGDYIAIVGPSGCGKSTLLRILLGFEQPATGKVYYDGQDLSMIDVRTVRRQMGVVLQNSQLMTGNLFNNIIGANPRLTIDDAWEAAARAGIDEDIREMPMGMHTVIGEGSGTISGGQKQRLMIARAIVNKPKILFFDEATSALDNRTQTIVSDSMDALKSTRLIIAHRLSTIINCNRILVMDQGKIVESGTYAELMGKKGFFADLVKRQLT